MSLATRIRTTDTRTRGDLSRIGGESIPSLAQAATSGGTMRTGRKGLVLIALLTCLVLVLSTYGGEAFAQGTTDEGFVKSVVSNVNAFWDKEFQQLGYPYSPANLVFVYDRPVDSPCGSFSTVDGPAYCPYDGTLYYPLYWLDDGRTLADYGQSAVEWGVAHEIGHHAQVQMDELGIQRMDVMPAEQVELQADCFAGMYADQATTRPQDIEAAIAAMSGAGRTEHGTSQQRMAAFELGYNTGDLGQCLALATEGTTTGAG